MDREKVIKGLDELREYLFHECKICYHGDKEDIYNRFLIVDNAIAMMEEHKAVMRTSRYRENGFGFVWTCGACGSDLHPNNRQAKFCSHCGRKVKWGV